MLTLELDSDELPDAVEVLDDGKVAEVGGRKGQVEKTARYDSWSAFCEHYDVDPAELLEEIIGQIDPGIRAEVDEREIDEPDAFLRACARLTEDED